MPLHLVSFLFRHGFCLLPLLFPLPSLPCLCLCQAPLCLGCLSQTTRWLGCPSSRVHTSAPRTTFKLLILTHHRQLHRYRFCGVMPARHFRFFHNVSILFFSSGDQQMITQSFFFPRPLQTTPMLIQSIPVSLWVRASQNVARRSKSVTALRP